MQKIIGSQNYPKIRMSDDKNAPTIFRAVISSTGKLARDASEVEQTRVGQEVCLGSRVKRTLNQLGMLPI